MIVFVGFPTKRPKKLHLFLHENFLFQSLLELHALGGVHNDPNFVDFLETEFLHEQVDAIKEISDYVTNLERVGDGLGVYMFDKHFAESS